MAPAKGVTIRSYEPGDERDIVRLFKGTYGAFAGPTKLTPARWREMHERGWWNRPSVVEDPECVRLLLRGSEVLGYLVFHQHVRARGLAYLQELCVADVADREELASLLMNDALKLLRERGLDQVTWMLSPADPFASGLADRFGFAKLLREPTVFMARVVSLESLLDELGPAFTRRLRAGRFKNWSGSIVFELEEQRAALRIRRGSAKLVNKVPAKVTLAVRTDQETLCRMAMGALRAEEAYQQDWLSVRPLEITLEGKKRRSLGLLDVLLPENRWSLPRAHSW